MRYILLFLTLLFFSACAPKYKSTFSYTEPSAPQAQKCIKRCKEQLTTCRALCKSNFELCKQNAVNIAKKNHDKKMQQYYHDLESYANRVEMYNLERELFYYDDFYYRGGYGYYGPFGGRLLWGPPPLYNLHKPVKPNLQQEVLLAQMKHCRIDCKCLDAYDNCFQGCGGKINRNKICIQNCPK